jgi:alpha-glucosidase
MNIQSSIIKTETQASEWWRGATIYQIYPRSFADSNGDGIGDLNGITNKLDYVASLGVDAIWISPFFKSPMKDYGYDVADYCDVDPIFGTLEDFDRLIEKAHSLGLKVTIDQVYSHTSDQHEWFAESRSSRTNAKADWYVWADAKPDGSPPCNWQSVFGGPAWTWDARRGQYYMHNFLSGQPQINGHNVQVQDALLSVARFWLDRGVDGFRIDALNFMMHDPELRDNPPKASNKVITRPFDFQDKKFNQGHPDIVPFIERIRALTDEYEAIFTVAEVGGDDADREMKLFTKGTTRLNSAYSFAFLYADELTPVLVKEALSKWPSDQGAGWPSWAFENHDAPRALSRWTNAGDRDAFARMKIALLLCLRGNAIVYQGEELGLTQVDIPFELLHDPEAIANWPLTLSRDGVRTPMPWVKDALNMGFTSGAPWLPLGDDHAPLAVDQQQADESSLFALTQDLIALRKDNAALKAGRVVRCDAQGDLLHLMRQYDDQVVHCVFNMGSTPLPCPELDASHILKTINDADQIILPPFGVLIIKS